jgi:ATP-binding cassette subfamily B protein/ATP-binding cassette subfamily C protein
MKKDLQIGLRFYKLVYRLYPAYLPKAFLAAFLQALVPFINVILPKLIIDELLGAQRASLLLQLVLFVALGNGILNVINRYMTYRMDEAYYDLMQRIELNMGNHIMNLDFEMLEDPAILNQKDQAIFPLRNQGVIRNMTMYTMQLIQYSLTLIGLMAIISRLNPLLIVFI